MTRKKSDGNPCTTMVFAIPSPFSICGYLPYSRQKCKKFARNHAQRYPEKFRKHDGAPNIVRADRNGLQVSQEVGCKPPLKLIAWPVI